MSQLVHECEHLFSDVSGRTDVMCHDIDIGNASPIKQHPYRIGLNKRKYLDEELKYMLENGIVEESNWSSPCILVPKSDSSFRF